MLPIFCLHLTSLQYRKNYCIDLFKKQNIKAEWIEEYDPDESFNKISKSIKNSELSLILKTKFVYDLQFKNNHENVLIFEDDIIIPDYFNFNIFLEKCLKEFKETNGDIFFMGGTRDFIVSNHQPTTLLYYNDNYFSRGTHAYVINIKCIEKVKQYISFNLPLDHLLNNIIKNNKLKCGWTHPYLEQWTDLNINQWKSAIHGK